MEGGLFLLDEWYVEQTLPTGEVENFFVSSKNLFPKTAVGKNGYLIIESSHILANNVYV